MTEIVGLIAARGGSKGIPRKNIIPLAGKPLMAWTIEAALQSKALTRLILSTDDEEIADVGRRFGAEVPFLRPAALAADDTAAIDVVEHVLDWLEKDQDCRPDYLLLLQPTSPFRAAEDIRGAIRLAEERNAEAVVSVCAAENHPFLTKRITEQGTLEDFVSTDQLDLRRQALPPAYALNGAIYLNRAASLRAHRSFLPPGTHAWKMEPERSIDIDTPRDLRLAELQLQGDAAVPSFDIAGRVVGPGHPSFVIAEAGVNHNGDPELARKLVDVAVQAGADAIKFQTFTADELATPDAPKAEYQNQGTDAEESQLEMLRRLELSPEAHDELLEYCQSKSIIFLSTPFDEKSADLLDTLGVAAIKIGSGELTNLPLLAHVAAMSRPLILSTGMAGMGEVETALQTVAEHSAPDVALLHCVSNYPAAVADVNLRAMSTLGQAFGVVTGYSDHTVGLEVSLAAVALGASIIEKHITLDRSLPGPDHGMSIEPTELADLVRSIRNVEAALGDGQKRATEAEAEIAAVARRSLVAAQDLEAGSVLTREMIAIRRPGTGLAPALLSNLLGRTLRAHVRAGSLLSLEMLA